MQSFKYAQPVAPRRNQTACTHQLATVAEKFFKTKTALLSVTPVLSKSSAYNVNRRYCWKAGQPVAQHRSKFPVTCGCGPAAALSCRLTKQVPAKAQQSGSVQHFGHASTCSNNMLDHAHTSTADDELADKQHQERTPGSSLA